MTTEAQITAAAEALNRYGLAISLPWEGDLDDLERERFEALKAALEAAEKAAWQPIASAPKDGTSVLLRTKDDFGLRDGDMRTVEGLTLVGRHPGLAENGFDIGWNFAAPVGYGGIPDNWIAGWRPLPDPPTESA